MAASIPTEVRTLDGLIKWNLWLAKYNGWDLLVVFVRWTQEFARQRSCDYAYLVASNPMVKVNARTRIYTSLEDTLL